MNTTWSIAAAATARSSQASEPDDSPRRGCPVPLSVQRRRGMAWWLVAILVVLLVGPGTVGAQQRMPRRAKPQPTKPQPTVTPKKEGEYGGVTPGKAPVKRKKQKNSLSWVGFQPSADGASRIFVQLSNEVTYRQEVREGVLYVKLDKVNYRNRNARRRLDTRFFDTAVREVTTRYVRRRRKRRKQPAQRAGIELRIQFKNPADAREARAEFVAEKDGYHYLFLAFDEPSGGTIRESDDQG